MKTTERQEENKRRAGRSGAAIGALVGPILIIANVMLPKDSEIGPLTIPLLIIMSALLLAPTGFLAGRITGGISSKNRAKKDAKKG